MFIRVCVITCNRMRLRAYTCVYVRACVCRCTVQASSLSWIAICIPPAIEFKEALSPPICLAFEGCGTQKNKTEQKNLNDNSQISEIWELKLAKAIRGLKASLLFIAPPLDSLMRCQCVADYILQVKKKRSSSRRISHMSFCWKLWLPTCVGVCTHEYQ